MERFAFSLLAIAWSALAAGACGNQRSVPEARPGRNAPPAAVAPPRSATELIDREVAAMWKQAHVTPAPDASDSEFIRRVTLDVAGRIPTASEVYAYLADRSVDKRAKLVDRLLASDDYPVYWAELFSDNLVGKVIRQSKKFISGYLDYLERCLREGRGFDRMAREMLAARGRMPDNGALGYLASYKLRGGSLDTLAGNTARAFLGLQIQCAQCHDHPTDKQWKKEDYAAFRAFFGELRLPREDQKMPWTTYTDDASFGFVAHPEAKREIKRVAPRFLHQDTRPEQGESRRDVLARMVVASPLFPRAAVGFTWDHLFGRGIVDPWDDLGSDNDPRQPRLLRELADRYARAGYDHRWLVRSIVLSKAYGRSSIGGTAPVDAAPNALEVVFARAQVRPLNADQVLRAHLLATGVEDATARGLQRWKEERAKIQVWRQYNHSFPDDEAAETDSFTGSVPQALLLRNGALTNAGVRAVSGTLLARVREKSSDPARRLEWLFMTALGRPPDAAEKKEYLAFIAGRGDHATAYEDLYHALLTSTEFITNH